jgi:acetyl esterase/lipase
MVGCRLIGGGAVPEEGVLDPWVAEWLEANPLPSDDFSPEFLALTRGSFEMPTSREIAQVGDDVIAGIRVRVYDHADEPTGLIVYFHGGGFCIGSVALMDNVARELAYATAAVVVSVEYRLAPENPYPAGLDDCETVSRFALANTKSFGAPEGRVILAGESAGGNLAAAVTLRLRDAHVTRRPAGQVLVYPVLDARGSPHASRKEFSGLIISEKMDEWFWSSYGGGRNIDRDPFAAPLQALTLADLPPALVILGGCDFLRDEGRAYAQRLREEGVETEEVSYPGQPHGFMNFGFPAARDAYDTIGRWARSHLAADIE